MKIRNFFSAVGALLLMLGFFAQPLMAQGTKTPAKKPRIVYEKETTIRFEDSLIEGKVIKPDGFFLLRNRPKKWQDLIQVRQNFRDELGEMKYEF